MARARNIKPGFYKNEDLAECSVWARLIFPGLWMLADREGRLEDRPKRIKGELLPFDSQDVEPLLRELEAHGFIHRYTVEGSSYIQISKFSTHQAPHYSEKASVIPAPDSGSPPPIKTASPPEDSGNPQGIKRGSQPPDSLNPDSLIPDSPNPDSGKSDSVAGSGAPEANATPPGSPRAAPRGSRLPADFVLPKPWGEWAMSERPGWTPDKVRSVSDQFRDHWHAKAGRDALKADWLAAWRTWVRREPTVNGANGASRAMPSKQAALEQRNAEVAARWLAKKEAENAAN